MGPLNEFQRRWLDVAQENMYLRAANEGGPPAEHFGYPLTITGPAGGALTNGVAAQGIINIQADAWFLWMYLSMGVTTTANYPYSGPDQITDGGNMLLQITNAGTGDDLYNLPAGLPGFPGIIGAGSPLAAAAGIPYMFPTPVLLPPNTNVSVVVTKLGTDAGGDNVDPLAAFIMLGGARVMVWS
jgi:hypothetical protein